MNKFVKNLVKWILIGMTVTIILKMAIAMAKGLIFVVITCVIISAIFGKIVSTTTLFKESK